MRRRGCAKEMVRGVLSVWAAFVFRCVEWSVPERMQEECRIVLMDVSDMRGWANVG